MLHWILFVRKKSNWKKSWNAWLIISNSKTKPDYVCRLYSIFDFYSDELKEGVIEKLSAIHYVFRTLTIHTMDQKMVSVITVMLLSDSLHPALLTLSHGYISYSNSYSLLSFKSGYIIEIRRGALLKFRKVLLLKNFEKIFEKMNQMLLKLQNISLVKLPFESPEFWFAKFSPNLAIIFLTVSFFLIDTCLFLVSELENNWSIQGQKFVMPKNIANTTYFFPLDKNKNENNLFLIQI